jgi:hypothetical protein
VLPVVEPVLVALQARRHAVQVMVGLKRLAAIVG